MNTKLRGIAVLLGTWAVFVAALVFGVQFIRGYIDGVSDLRHENATLAAALAERTEELDRCRATTNVSASWPRYKQVRLSGEMLVYFAGEEHK